MYHIRIHKYPFKLSITLILGLFTIFAYKSISNGNILMDIKVHANSTSVTRLDAINQELIDLRNQKQDLKDSLNSESLKRSKYGYEVASLSTQLSVMITEVKEKDLTIEKLDLEIEILNYNIGKTNKNITKKLKNIKGLEKQTTSRLTDMYITMKSYSNISVLFSSNGSGDFIKNELYTKAVQDDTNSKLTTLQNDRRELISEKKSLDTDRIQVEKDKTIIDEQRIALAKQQTLLDQQRKILNTKIQQSLNSQQSLELKISQSSKEEQQLLAEQELLKQQILQEISKIANGTYVLKGTIIGFEGMTGWATGPHLHFGVAKNGVTQNPCNYVNCGSLSNGVLGWPISPSGVITSGYGQRAYDFHAAIDISTGGTGSIKAAHNGWVVYGNQTCWNLTWVNCNGGFAKYAIVCEDQNNCNNGFKTIYWHLK